MRFNFGNFGNFGGFNEDPESGEYSWTPPKRENQRAKKPRKAMSKGKSIFLSLLITIVFGFLYFYFSLPALNIHSGDLYVFIILLCLVWCAASLISAASTEARRRSMSTRPGRRPQCPSI